MGRNYTYKLAALLSLLFSQLVFISPSAHAALPLIPVPLSTGTNSTCVIRAADDLYCVGSNSHGQLGNGNQISTSDPQKVVGISNVTAVSVGTTSACAINHLGSLFCWGENTFGQLGIGNTEDKNIATLVPGISNVVRVAVGKNFACALNSSSSLFCWGANNKGQLTTDTKQFRSVPTLTAQTPTGISQITINGERVCVLATDVYCWGDFESYIFPNESRNWVPTKLANSAGALAVELGEDFGCFVLQSSVACWGTNDHGQLGSGTRTRSAIPVTVSGISSVKDITTGGHFACVLDNNGDTYCWGENQQGQLIVSSKLDQLNRIPTGAPKSVAIEAGDNNLCLLELDAAITCFGDSSSGQSGYLLASGVPLTNTAVSQVSKVATGTNTTCIVSSSGSLQCWGELVPIIPEGLAFTNVSVGDSSACAISFTKKVYCWGSNSAGQLGNNSNRNSLEISQIDLINANFLMVSVGYRHACAITEDGLSYCWGDNGKQQLGFVGADSRTPVAVPGIGTATSISVGDYHSCAIQTGGSVYCWGDNSKKQLNSSNLSALSPIALVTDNPVSSIALGASITCLLDNSQSVRCLGDNTKKAAPGSIAGKFSSISTGGNTVCLVNLEQKAYCFGSADSSKLGSLLVDTATPVKISDELLKSVSVGSKHACTVNISDKLSCWGSNAFGQLTSSFGFSSAYSKPVITISGSKAVGETLEVVVNSSETKTINSYIWKRASSLNSLLGNLVSQTGETYSLSAGDLGKYFAVEVRQSKWGTTSVGVTSALTSAIGSPIRLLMTPNPTITGATKVGRVLTARAGRWDTGTKLSYQWYRGKSVIKGATKPTYAVSTADVGKAIFVSVTGVKVGLPKVVVRSLSTPKISR